MNPLVIHELAQIEEQERMHAALRRAALRAARRDAGLSWTQVLRARLFGRNGHAPAAAAEPRPRVRVAAASADAQCADC